MARVWCERRADVGAKLHVLAAMRTTWSLALAASLVSHVAVGQAPAPPLEVMAFNVLFNGADDAKSVKAVADAAPDLVCLTELTPRFVGAFEGALASDYPHRHFAPQKGTWGVGLASKRPLKDVVVTPIAPSRIPSMEATVDVGGAPVRVVCVHLTPPMGKHRKSDDVFQTLEKNAAVREKQAATLVARFAKTKTPVVLLGDFNEEPGGAALRALEKAGWARGCSVRGASCTPTFPGAVVAWPAVFLIDHVYARGMDFTDARTLRTGGSDHFPVTARLKARSAAP
jgi:endonuclease/exonuclease/phosphatase (EEP) superfamily protein YafD